MSTGPERIEMKAFDSERDFVYRYRLNLTRDLFNTFCTSIMGNDPVTEFCSMIAPPDRELLNPNCYYNYYIEVGLDDEAAMGRYFKDNTDLELYIGFREMHSKN